MLSTVAVVAAFAEGVTPITVSDMRAPRDGRNAATAAALRKMSHCRGYARRTRRPWRMPHAPSSRHTATTGWRWPSRAGAIRPGRRYPRPACVRKTYPSFWRDLDRLGVRGRRRRESRVPGAPRACVADLTFRANEVLLIRRAYEPRRGHLTFPGGGIESRGTAASVRKGVSRGGGSAYRFGPVIDDADVMQPTAEWRYHYTILTFWRSRLNAAAEARPGSDAAMPAGECGRSRKYELTPVALTCSAGACGCVTSRPEHTGATRTLFEAVGALDRTPHEKRLEQEP
jgi:hypothetical protein